MNADEEDLRRRLVLRSCVEREGFPECMGAAAEHGCTCLQEGLAPGEHDEAVCVAWAHYHDRQAKACHDCAFRRGSPEMESGLALQILENDRVMFYCHQGMPIDARFGDAEIGNYVPDDPRRYPPCMGFVAMRLGQRVR